ncbi:MAG TPA: SDR family NAD(P)-dependent oxidoreductase, partial [Pyrinomonadaceae bacterium]
ESGATPSVVFMFPGQGAQRVQMARQLYEVEGVFRAEVDYCAKVLKSYLGCDVREIIYPAAGSEEAARERLQETMVTQPAMFTIEYALAQVLKERGVAAEAMIGHSIGEYVAATVAGVFSLEDALAVVAARGRLMQDVPPGAMLAVPLSEAELMPMLNAQLSLAAVNGPEACVVAGPFDAIAAFEERLGNEGVRCLRLKTSHAFHSVMLEPILGPFVEQLRRVRLRPPQTPYISNVTGDWITADEATNPNYWVRHLRQTVQFSKGLDTLMREPGRVFLEVGPGKTLSTLARKHPAKAAGHVVLNTLPGASDQRPDELILLQAMGQLWLAGVEVKWKAFSAHEQRRRVPLPTYPFERQRYWIEPRQHSDNGAAQQNRRQETAGNGLWFAIPSWKRTIPPLPFEPDKTTARTTWLIFTNRCSFSSEVADLLRRGGQQVIEALAGESFGRMDDGAYVINPRERADYAALFTALRDAGDSPKNILHAWNITPDETCFSQPEYREQSLRAGFYSLLFLAQTLGAEERAEDINVAVVSTHSQKVAGEAMLFPEQATIVGACKVITQEYPRIICRSIDVSLSARVAGVEGQLAGQVISECLADAAERVVAYREHDRWAQTFEMADVPPASEGKSLLRDGGVYLITGGLGGLGLLLAEHLAKTVKATLALTGRGDFPPPTQWKQWLATHPEPNRINEQIQRLQAIEQLGAQVLVVRADTADYAQMQAALKQVTEQCGAIHGVFHAAGIAGGGLIQLKTVEEVERVFAAKVQGTRVLEAVLKETPLDFLILFSSTLALTGGIGQIDYCAANAFLDAFAHYAATDPAMPLTISINWDGWRSIGMTAMENMSDGAKPSFSVNHPLLDRCLSATPEHAHFVTDFQVEKHWVLNEHKVAGAPTLPGVAYVEMARAAFAELTKHDAMTLQDVIFLAPLMTDPDGRKEVHTVFDKKGERFEFRILGEGEALAGEPQQRWKEYARGKVSQAERNGDAAQDLSQIMARCPREIVITEADERAEQGSLVEWGERWKNLKKVYVGTDEALALLELPAEFAADLSSLYLHPALLDVATGFMGLISEMSDYVPLSYRSIAINAPLPQTFYSYSKKRPTDSANAQRVGFDVTILDLQGKTLLRIENFVLVHDSLLNVPENEQASARRPTVSPPPLAAHASAANGHSWGSTSDEGIAPAAGIEALDRILAGVRLPQIVVSTEEINTQVERAKTLTLERVLKEMSGSYQSTEAAHPRPTLQTAFSAPGNETEKKVAAVWEEVLGVEQIGINDNFFDLGGHSLLAAQIVEQLRQTFNLDIPLNKVVEAATVANIAQFIITAQKESEEREQMEILSKLAELSEEEAEAELRRRTST